LPALLLYRDTQTLQAPAAGQLVQWQVQLGQEVKQGQLLARLQDERFQQERVARQFDVQLVELRLSQSDNSGDQGGYRRWLLAEKARLLAALAKVHSAEQLLEIRASRAGRVVALNERLREGVFVAEKSHLLTLATSQKVSVSAYVNEALLANLPPLAQLRAELVISGRGWFGLQAEYLSPLPVRRLPNQSLYDFAGGPLVALRQGRTVEPKEAQFELQFQSRAVPLDLPHGARVWVWVVHRGDALLDRFSGWFVQQLK